MGKKEIKKFSRELREVEWRIYGNYSIYIIFYVSIKYFKIES